jgi:molybdopterin/thiamine biosynthesis adenylyltransferase
MAGSREEAVGMRRSGSGRLEAEIREAVERAEGRQVISFDAMRRLAERFGGQREVELAALRLDVVPARYLRNVGTVGVEGQLKLLQSTAAVVGLGGLGGYVVEALARMGVGRLTLIDGDVFDAHNLNRQLLSREGNLGRRKAQEACRRVQAVNGAVEAVCVTETLTEQNLPELLNGTDVVVDALDSLSVRLILQDGAAELGIPMVHGSIGGFLGQVMTVLPGDRGLHALYGDGSDLPEHGVEWEMGTPAATPMAVAAWEAQEVVKILTDQGELLRERLLVLDMVSGTAQTLKLS